VPPFAGLQDAAQKLDVLSGPTSPLLGMLLTVSQHIAVDPTGVKPKLQPVDVVMPLANAKTFVGGNNSSTWNRWVTLQRRTGGRDYRATGGTAPLEQAASAVGPARDAVRKLAVKFSQEPEALLRLQDLLLSPVVGTEQLVKVALGGKKREGEAADVNAQALAFCEDIRPILDKYPFVLSARTKATNSDLARVFRPNGGRISQLTSNPFGARWSTRMAASSGALAPASYPPSNSFSS
jgi:type VI protein secretion system component VasK